MDLLLLTYLKVYHFLDRFKVLERVRDVELLKHERKGRVVATHALDRRLEAQEAPVLDRRRNLRSEAASLLIKRKTDKLVSEHEQMTRH